MPDFRPLAEKIAAKTAEFFAPQSPEKPKPDPIVAHRAAGDFGCPRYFEGAVVVPVEGQRSHGLKHGDPVMLWSGYGRDERGRVLTTYDDDTREIPPLDSSPGQFRAATAEEVVAFLETLPLRHLGSAMACVSDLIDELTEDES